MGSHERGDPAGTVAPPRPHPGGGRPEPLLVGRDEPLAAVGRAIDLVDSGALRVVLVTGAAGLGKTRLVSEALSRHSDRLTVLSARAYRWGTNTSLGLWIEAIDRHLRSDAQPDDATRHLGTALTVPAASSPDQQPRQDQLLETLVEILARLCARGPVGVILDDVHLADPTSWQALRYVARRLPYAPLGVFATARPAELRRDPAAQEVLVGLTDDRILTRVPLHPLTRPEIAALAHDVLRTEPAARTTFVPDQLVSWLVERSLGHPLFVIGLLRALVRERADLSAPRLERLPEVLRERVAVDLGQLEEEQRAVLELLAVLDVRVPAVDLAEVSDRSADEVPVALERLAAAQLVAEDGHATDLRYEIAHPIIQEAVYEEIGGARRQTLHRTVARGLLRRGQVAAAAAHFARAAGPGDGEAAAALCRALSDAQDRGLYREVLAVLDALLVVLPVGDERWLPVIEAMDWQSEWVLSHLVEGDAEIAIAATERMAELLAARGDLPAQATVEFHRAAFLSFGAGRIEEAERACRRAVQLFAAAGDVEGELTARNELAWIRGCAGDLAGHAELAGAVLRRALDEGLDPVAVQASGTQAYALGVTGRFEAAEAGYERTATLAGQAGNTYRIAWAEAQRALMLGLAGRPREGVATAEYALRTDPMAPDAIALEDLAHNLWLLGRLDEALSALQRSATRRPLRGSRRRSWGGALAARLYAEMGQAGRARRNLELAAGAYDGAPMLTWGCWPLWTEGFLAWREGAYEDARGPLTATAEQLRGCGAAPYEALVLADLVEVTAEDGAVDRLDAIVDRLTQVTDDVGGGLMRTVGALGSAWRSLVGGDRERAAATAAEAVRTSAACGYELHRATALTLLGRSREDDRRAAVDALSEAARIQDASGAVWRRDRTLAVLRRWGARGQRAAAEIQGPGSLTGREREVAELAALGHTAREIGERLFISPRTVETHLANAYGKLGVASKRELVRRAEELGLRPGPPAAVP